jgi:uncharacterized membrane protein
MEGWWFDMDYGPVDLLVIRFPDNTFTGEIVEELKALVDSDTVRVMDLIFVTRSRDGAIEKIELTDLDDAVAVLFDAFIGELEGLFSSEDAQVIGSSLKPDTSAALLLYENVWARKFASAVARVNGEVLVAERIPRAVIQEMRAEAETPA